MLSINTNLSSIITQNSMKQSTNKLNEAIERMTTGYKINHAKDNAANYSISTNMATKISAYDVAADNVAMGMDMLTTATESLGQIENKLTRLRALATQAQNGTYGGQSLSAIQAEADSITKEIERLYSTAEYNGVKLLDTRPEIPQGIGLTKDLTPRYDGFIENPKDYTDKEVRDMDKLSEVDPNTTISSGQYSISSDKELKQLADMVNAGKVTGGEFVLANDIDLSEYVEGEGWTPIGNSSKVFKATFNGNGNKITGLYINRPNLEDVGLFGQNTGTIRNLAVEECDIKGKKFVGAIVGSSRYSHALIENCYSTGKIRGEVNDAGGITGYMYGGKLNYCYSTCDISVENSLAGGLVGIVQLASAKILNCFAEGNIDGGQIMSGGLLGRSEGFIENCYATGNVKGQGSCMGGFAGSLDSLGIVNHCYSTGDVEGTNTVGGFAGIASSKIITNCYSKGNVHNKKGSYQGGFLGSYKFDGDAILENIRVYGDVEGGNDGSGGFIGELTGYNEATLKIKNVITYSNLLYRNADMRKVGEFIGAIFNTKDEITYSNIEIIKSGSLDQNINKIGNVYKQGGVRISYDMTDMLAGIKEVELPSQDIFLQVGTSSDENSSITFNSKVEYDILKGLKNFDITLEESFSFLDKFLTNLSDKQTQLGAAQNRLESAMDEIITQHDNLISARSTLRDADMAELSSQYIQQQILQEASATLMATANQSPAIALQLI